MTDKSQQALQQKAVMFNNLLVFGNQKAADLLLRLSQATGLPLNQCLHNIDQIAKGHMQ